jgi:hypothetical protein
VVAARSAAAFVRRCVDIIPEEILPVRFGDGAVS